MGIHCPYRGIYNTVFAPYTLNNMYLVEFPEEKYIIIIHEIINFDVRQTMHYQHNEIPDAIHPLLPHEQNLTRVFVKEGIAERVLGVIIGRQGRRDEKGDFGYVHDFL